MRRNFAARQTTAPSATPISVDDLKAHLRINGLTDDVEDANLTAYIAAAVNLIERWCNIALITQVWTGKLDFSFDGKLFWDWGGQLFPLRDEIPLPGTPLQDVTSITYVDEDGDVQTLDQSLYTVDTLSRPGRILRAYNTPWPSIRPQRQAVTIVWEAGFGDDGSHVPDAIKHAMKLICGDFYANRENTLVGTTMVEMPWAARALLSTYKLYSFGE